MNSNSKYKELLFTYLYLDMKLVGVCFGEKIYKYGDRGGKWSKVRNALIIQYKDTRDPKEVLQQSYYLCLYPQEVHK